MSIKLEVGTAITTILSTELNSLATAAATALGAEVDGTTALDIWGAFELTITSSTPTDLSVFELYIVPAPDGTNYGDVVTGASGRAPSNFFVGAFELRNVTSLQRISLWDVKLPPTKWKPLLISRAGSTLAASGNLLKFIGYRLQ